MTLFRLNIICLLASMFFIGNNAFAAPNKKTVKKIAMPQVEEPQYPLCDAYTDSLVQYRLKTDSLLRVQDSLQLISVNPINARMYRLFVPMNYYHSVVGKRFAMGTESADTTIDRALMDIYLRRADLVRYTDTRLQNKKESSKTDTPLMPKIVDMKSQVVKENPVKEIANEVQGQSMNMFIAKPNFWSFSGDYDLQFLQNYVSPNWYKGGSNNYSMLGTVTLQMNYNNKSKLKWNNKLEMKLGFQTSEADTINKFKAMEDLLRLTSSIGVQAHKNWYYTAQVIANTQFAQGRKDNKTNVYSDFMSPFNLNVSLGMDYTVKTRNNKLTGNVHLAPLAYNMKYVDRKNLAKNFGIEPDKQSLHDYGSQMTVDLTWAPSEIFKWQMRLYAYTTYEKVEAQCENTLTLKLSKYISTKLFLHPRFDDSVKRKDDESLLQFKEYLGLTFGYSM